MKAKKFLLFTPILLMVLIFSSCHDSLNCVEGNGHVTIEYRDVPAFYGIVSEGSFDVVIIQDTLTEVSVSAESNLIGYIRTQVRGSNLEISLVNNRCIDNNYPVTITIRTPELESAVIEGSGNIFCDEFITPSLNLSIIGSGNIDVEAYTDYLEAVIPASGHIKLYGNSKVSEYVISGSGNITADDFMVETCYATISGSGSIFVYATDLLDVKISGSGSVYYRGNPTIIQNISGSGKIYPL